MSTLVERVNAELKASMKARDKARTSALRMIRAAFIEEAKLGRGEVDDGRAVTILRRIKKQRLDAAAQYAAVGAEDRAAGERAEAAVADEFLPQQADEATTRAWVAEVIEELGASSMKDMGRVMGALSRRRGDQLDKALASRLVRETLS